MNENIESKNFDLQPYLFDDLIEMLPLKENDFDELFKAAADPLLWEQHPNKDRYKEEVFRNFFKGAMESGGAFIVKDKKTMKVIGSSRYYDYNKEENSVSVGYTFISRDCWGKSFNPKMKKLMLDHAFEFVDKVYFHIGKDNIRSQKAIIKTGAVKVDEIDMRYFGEEVHRNFIYLMEKDVWGKISNYKLLI
ncbi:MAG TPA: GNAT family N-acetyltransferase [Ignavibacteria bacterium]|nr:GNAT family N-acetyltransferase [Ignavibacteria bacterium]